MLRHLFFALAGLCLLRTANAQTTNGPAGDAIYFTNGDRFKNAQLVSVTADKVKFTVKRGEVLTNYTYGRDNVIMAFTQEGNYLIIKDISSDFNQADQQLKDFLMAPARTAPTDLLVRRVPLEVLRGLISYESDEVVNYQPATGGAASINKNELLMIFYRDGKHQILGDPNEIAPILTELRPQLLAPNVAAPEPAPTVATVPDPAPVVPTRPAKTAPAPNRSVKPAATTPPPAPAPTTPEPAPAPVTVSTPAPASGSGAKVSLNESEYITYRAKAMQRVDEFVSYINIITDKTLSGDDKDRAIDEAVRLFMPGATVAVTSASKPNPPRTLDVRTYLTRLKLLPYTYTKVNWSEVQYVKELTQAPDGNYYGIITGQQTFTGYGKADAVSYSDVTQKNVRVKLQPYQKMIEGQAETNWQVLLGNVGVGSN